MKTVIDTVCRLILFALVLPSCAGFFTDPNQCAENRLLRAVRELPYGVKKFGLFIFEVKCLRSGYAGTFEFVNNLWSEIS